MSAKQIEAYYATAPTLLDGNGACVCEDCCYWAHGECRLLHAREQLAERDRRDAELRESLELYKGHELTLEGLVRAVFRWGAGEGPKAPSATDREAQVQREAEEFYDEVKP